MTLGKSYRLVKPVVTFESYVRGINAIRHDPKVRLTTSPFGITPEQYETDPPIYVGDAVRWKGTKHAKGATGMTKEFLERAPKEVVAGLRAAIKISKKYAGTKGTVLYNGKLYPAKCIAQKEGKAG